MDREKTQIVLPDGCTEITIREGSAVTPLPLKESKSLNIEGDIHAISDFVKIRRDNAEGVQVLDANTIVVESDKNGRKIVMSLNPAGHANTTITAKLQMSEELKQFGINTETRYNQKSLLKLLKFSRLYFGDITTYTEVISGLLNIRMKSENELNSENDNKGNRRNLDETRLIDKGDFKDTFTLSVPLFRGFDPVKIEVEICFEIIDNKISFWLESVGLRDATDGAIDGIFETELANVGDYVIIHK